jgi:cell division protein FtsZ
MTSGANALKLENEVLNEEETSSSGLVDAHVLNSEDTSINTNTENHQQETILPISEEIKEEINDEPSNGLENFGIEEETPDLFNSDEGNSVTEITSSENDEDNDDDFEIPAFLRRQKN